MKPTLQQLLRWAKGKGYIEIYCDGSAEIQMERDDFGTNYYGDTLYQALYNAWKAEKK